MSHPCYPFLTSAACHQTHSKAQAAFLHGAQAHMRPDTRGRGTMPSPAAPSALAPRLHQEFSNSRLFLQDTRGLFLQLLKVVAGNVTSFLRT